MWDNPNDDDWIFCDDISSMTDNLSWAVKTAGHNTA